MKSIKKLFLITLGSISVVLGMLGIVLPLVPTTPFLLLGAYCYCKSSQKLYDKLLNSKWLGQYIKDYQSGKGIPMKSKVAVVILLWVSISFSTIFIIPLLYVKLVMWICALTLTIFVFLMKTKKA